MLRNHICSFSAPISNRKTSIFKSSMHPINPFPQEYKQLNSHERFATNTLDPPTKYHPPLRTEPKRQHRLEMESKLGARQHRKVSRVVAPELFVGALREKKRERDTLSRKSKRAQGRVKKRARYRRRASRCAGAIKRLCALVKVNSARPFRRTRAVRQRSRDANTASVCDGENRLPPASSLPRRECITTFPARLLAGRCCTTTVRFAASCVYLPAVRLRTQVVFFSLPFLSEHRGNVGDNAFLVFSRCPRCF